MFPRLAQRSHSFPLRNPDSRRLRTDSSRTELVEAKDEERLVDLEAEDLRLNERKRLAVDLDQTLALLAVGDGSGSLLLAEALNALNGRHGGGVVDRGCGGGALGDVSSSSVRTIPFQKVAMCDGVAWRLFLPQVENLNVPHLQYFGFATMYQMKSFHNTQN